MAPLVQVGLKELFNSESIKTTERCVEYLSPRWGKSCTEFTLLRTSVVLVKADSIATS